MWDIRPWCQWPDLPADPAPARSCPGQTLPRPDPATARPWPRQTLPRQTLPWPTQSGPIVQQAHTSSPEAGWPVFVSLTKHIEYCGCLLLLFYILATSNVISGWVPTGTVHTHGDFIVLPHWDISNQYHDHPTHSGCPSPILIMPSAWPRSDKYQFKSHWFDSTRVRQRRTLYSFN